MEREFLDWMPLDLLGPGVDAHGRDLEHTLKRLGIQRLGKIAQLDIRAVGTRLGARGVELARLARGEDTATIVARPRAAIFSEALELEYGIEQLEALGFILRGMLTNLTARLGMRGFAAGDMTLSLGLSDHRRDERRVAVAAPTLEPRALLTLLLLSLEASPPPAAIETIRLTLEACPLRAAQSDLFRPPTPAPDRLETTLARIAALCGPDRVGMLAVADSYRPEALRLTAFVPPPVTDAAPDAARMPAANGVARIMLRTIRPPMEVEVMCAGMAPEFVRGASVSARVVSAAGPWRRQGEWWTGDFAAMPDTSTPDGAASHHASWQAAAPAAYLRDYYELALAEAGVYRVYRDLHSGKWYVDGIYD
jgi:protein ImuB